MPNIDEVLLSMAEIWLVVTKLLVRNSSELCKILQMNSAFNTTAVITNKYAIKAKKMEDRFSIKQL